MGSHDVSCSSTEHHYSNSMFVIEVEGRPSAIFETKWDVDAELICRTWTNNHWEQLMVKGHGRLKIQRDQASPGSS